MSGRFRRLVALCTAAIAAGSGMVAVSASSAVADAGDVVVNELMTRPGRPPTPPTSSSSSTTGGPIPSTCRVGVQRRDRPRPDALPAERCGHGPGVPAGTVIASHDYFVGSSNTAVFATVTGQSADFSFAPSGLSRAGDGDPPRRLGCHRRQRHVRGGGPWPSTPNGTGPSLELVDPFLDNGIGTNWGASTGDNGTPNAQNSVYGAPPPTLTGVAATPARPAPGQAFTVRATMPLGATATLTSKVMFGADVTVPFRDDAASVGGANDGTYSAVSRGHPRATSCATASTRPSARPRWATRAPATRGATTASSSPTRRSRTPSCPSSSGSSTTPATPA